MDEIVEREIRSARHTAYTRAAEIAENFNPSTITDTTEAKLIQHVVQMIGREIGRLIRDERDGWS